jgi:hypothetical protein
METDADIKKLGAFFKPCETDRKKPAKRPTNFLNHRHQKPQYERVSNTDITVHSSFGPSKGASSGRYRG